MTSGWHEPSRTTISRAACPTDTRCWRWESGGDRGARSRPGTSGAASTRWRSSTERLRIGSDGQPSAFGEWVGSRDETQFRWGKSPGPPPGGLPEAPGGEIFLFVFTQLEATGHL